MPPKPAVSKKTEQKKKEKVIEVRILSLTQFQHEHLAFRCSYGKPHTTHLFFLLETGFEAYLKIKMLNVNNWWV
jgi:hypothetical protein